MYLTHTHKPYAPGVIMCGDWQRSNHSPQNQSQRTRCVRLGLRSVFDIHYTNRTHLGRLCAGIGSVRLSPHKINRNVPDVSGWDCISVFDTYTQTVRIWGDYVRGLAAFAPDPTCIRHTRGSVNATSPHRIIPDCCERMATTPNAVRA